MSDAINSVSSTSAASAADTSARIPTQTLGQSDFLRLLAAQLSCQDPLNPESNTDFSAQMAQFSALEQSKTMSSNISKLNSQQDFSEAAALLGRTVQVQTAAGTTVLGVVSGMTVDNGNPQLVINGQTYDLSDVLGVATTTSSQ